MSGIYMNKRKEMPVRRRIRTIGKWGGYGIACVVSAFLVYGVWVEPNKIEIHHVSVYDAELAALLGNSVVAQISDLHVREMGRRERNVLEIVRALDPDILLLTGD